MILALDPGMVPGPGAPVRGLVTPWSSRRGRVGRAGRAGRLDQRQRPVDGASDERKRCGHCLALGGRTGDRRRGSAALRAMQPQGVHAAGAECKSALC